MSDFKATVKIDGSIDSWKMAGLGVVAFIGAAWLCANCQRERTELLTLEVAEVLPLNNNYNYEE